MKKTLKYKVEDCIIMIFLIGIALIAVYPFYYVVVRSVLPYEYAVQSKFYLIPPKITFDAYKNIFSYEYIVKSMGVSLFITVISLILHLVTTMMMAYGLGKPYLPGRKFIMLGVIFTMFFNGGVVPSYLLIKQLGLIDNYLALILPGMIATYNLIVSINFFTEFPKEMEEAAKIDGASTYTIFFKIVLPLSMPIITTIGLFIAVGTWNSWYNAMLYINNKEMWPLALVLRDILIEDNTRELNAAMVGNAANLSESLKMATIVVSVIPVMIMYPFIQKYFTKGVMLGAVKS